MEKGRNSCTGSAPSSFSTLFVLLLLAHVGGMIEYQVFHGDTLERMNPFVISDT
jgi:hypothetical protein